jgi:sugar lactone lactonase YvrE
VALLWLLWLGWSTNGIAQDRTGTTVAGGSKGNKPSQLDTVQAVFVDRAGYIYVADQVNNRIMKFAPNSSMGISGTIVAGGNDYGAALNQLAYPTGVFVDTVGAVYVSDRDNHRIMKFPPNSSKDTLGTIVAGYNAPGSNSNQLHNPGGVFVDGDGAIYVADTYNHRIMMFTPGSTQATHGTPVNGKGDGTSGTDNTLLYYPSSVFVDHNRDVYVADSFNHRIMKFPSGSREGTTVAGDKGQGKEAYQLNFPSGVYVDSAGYIYVADYNNHRIQQFVAGTISGTTVAGVTEQADNDDKHLRHPTGVFVDQTGAIYVADAENYRIQKFSPKTLPLEPVPFPQAPVTPPLANLTPGTPVAHVGITIAGVTGKPRQRTQSIVGSAGRLCGQG